jgi:rhodanese-related sulfurtransferase
MSGGDVSRTTVDQLLEAARDSLTRVTPVQAQEALAAGAVLIDIRSDSQRAQDGVIPGARFVPRNVLEWRCDPSSPYRDDELCSPDVKRLILICNEGYQSSLAAATLQQIVDVGATDVIGGFQAWRADGLEVSPQDPADA